MIAIDPGLKVSGVAWFEDDELFCAELVKADGLMAMAEALIFHTAGEVEVVCEKMHVYSKNQFAAKALIDLSILAGWLRPDYLYTYQQWAGSLKESQLWERILSRLSPQEKAVLPKRLGPHKDVLAAVGIGLHHLGRLKPRSGY